MGTWQLFVDETGDFRRTGDSLAVGGWLVEGYANKQLSTVLRRALDSIFTGASFPQHAAHHNCPSSLLFEPFRSGGVGAFPPRFAERISRAYELVRDSTATPAATLRTRFEAARSVRDVRVPDLRAADEWLAKGARAEWTALREEAHTQSAELCAFLENQLAPSFAGRQAVIAAWKHSRTSDLATDAKGDGDYCELFETMLERALALVAERDGEARLWVHVAARPTGSTGARRLVLAKEAAKAHPLLRRAAAAPCVIDLAEHEYNADVHPGIVLADFMVNRVRHALSGPSGWSDVETVVRGRTGIPPTGRCGLVERRDRELPAIAGTRQDRAAVRCASEGKDSPIGDAAPWARQQAAMWIDAIRAGTS